MNINLNFGGFYESQHSDLIDQAINSQFDDDYIKNNNIDINKINYQKTNINYCKKYLEFIENYLLNFDKNFNKNIHFERLNLEIDLKFIELKSPKFYNYSTDEIIININKNDSLKIVDFVKNYFLDELKNYIKDITTSRSGYVAFYKFDEVFIKNKDNTLVEACFKIICDQVNKSDDLNEFYDLEIEFDN